jgi:hypothetical protein
LPLVHRPGRNDDEFDCGLLCDLLGWRGLAGYRATVFIVNLFFVPEHLEDFLALPKATFDTPEELLAAGWRVD